jgi:hypothetical protein
MPGFEKDLADEDVYGAGSVGGYRRPRLDQLRLSVETPASAALRTGAGMTARAGVRKLEDQGDEDERLAGHIVR